MHTLPERQDIRDVPTHEDLMGNPYAQSSLSFPFRLEHYRDMQWPGAAFHDLTRRNLQMESLARSRQLWEQALLASISARQYAAVSAAYMLPSGTSSVPLSLSAVSTSHMLPPLAHAIENVPGLWAVSSLHRLRPASATRHPATRMLVPVQSLPFLPTAALPSSVAEVGLHGLASQRKVSQPDHPVGQRPHSTVMVRSPCGVVTSSGTSSSAGSAQEEKASTVPDFPVCEANPIPDHPFRTPRPLGIDEDVNWLSEFHCFVRSELLEVFRASPEDCKARGISLLLGQVGIRCRHCAHLPMGARTVRSAAFPSSLSQIYQSFTMMLREHFPNCGAVPAETRSTFVALRESPSQGAIDSRNYWAYSAGRIGMADSDVGIVMRESPPSSEESVLPFGNSGGEGWEDDAFQSSALARPSDRDVAPHFLLLVMSQAQIVRLRESERIGSRRSLSLGRLGFACRFCCERRRLGQCRMFPARRRTLPGKMVDLYDHLCRCALCPAAVKEELKHAREAYRSKRHPGTDRAYFDSIWNRLNPDQVA
jgi:hypothetical protein